MPSSADRQDPFFAFRFEIRIDDLPVGGFSEVTGLTIETETHDHAEGGLNSNLLKFPTRTKQSNLTLKRGIADRTLHDWYRDLVAGKVERKNGSVVVYDPAGSEVRMEWQFVNAFPCKWTGPDLNASQSNVAVESVELCHEGLRRRT